MSSADRAKTWEHVLERLRRQYGEAAELEVGEGGEGRADGASGGAANGPATAGGGGNTLGDPLLRELMRGFLAWECASSRAEPALLALDAAFVDLNELRVSLVDEIVAVIGRNYPRANERCSRLRGALNDIYRREHAVRLSQLQDKNKRDARAYLEELAETPGYVKARVFLLGLGGHAIPVDERLTEKLIGAGIVEEGAGAESAAGIIEKLVKAGDGLEAHRLLQAWADDASAKPARPARAGAAGGGGGGGGAGTGGTAGGGRPSRAARQGQAAKPARKAKAPARPARAASGSGPTASPTKRTPSPGRRTPPRERE